MSYDDYALREQANFVIENEASKITHQLNRIATALERDVDDQADAGITQQLLEAMQEKQTVELLLRHSRYAVYSYGKVQRVRLGCIMLRSAGVSSPGAEEETLIRVSAIEGVRVIKPEPSEVRGDF